MKGLPPDAATWRAIALPPAEELILQLLERTDAWSRIDLKLRTAKRSVQLQVPPPVRVLRPGDEDPPERKPIETDPRAIAAFFAKHVSR